MIPNTNINGILNQTDKQIGQVINFTMNFGYLSLRNV